MRILVTGSRDWPSEPLVWTWLDKTIAEFCRDSSVTIVHGGARGADTMAHNWCDSRPMYGQVFVIEEIHRAAWNGPQGRRAGIWRNRRMVDTGIDHCLAFIYNNSKGATNCADLAEHWDIPTRRFTA